MKGAFAGFPGDSLRGRGASDPATGAPRYVILALCSIAAMFVIWQATSTLVFHSILFPSVGQTAAALAATVRAGVLPRDISVTALRVLVGFVLGSLGGASVGLLMGSVAAIRKFFEPYLNFFRFVTPIAWVAPATIWFGIGETAKLFLVVYATIFIVLVNTMSGVAHVHRDRIRMARAFGARPWQVFRHITLPASVPFIVTGMRIGMGNSFMTVIGAEMLAGQNGLGYLIYSSRVFFRSDVMFATIVVLGALGFAADRVFDLAQHCMLRRYHAR